MIVVPGPPVPKPRQTRRDRWAMRPCVARYRAWADLVRACAAGRGSAKTYELRFYLPLPKSKPGNAGQPHEQKPDVDNLIKATMDALLPAGDQKVFRVVATKFWEDAHGPRTEIIPGGGWWGGR